MDNNELLGQIAQMMDEQSQSLEARLKAQTLEFVEMVEERMDEQTRQIKVLIENDVTKRIDALFDGYKLTHEKQWEMERKLEEMERRLERLEAIAV